MDASKRVVKKTAKLIEYEESKLKKTDKPLKVKKSNPKQQQDIVKEAIPIIPRTLELGNISKQDLRDFYNIDNPFYTNNFHTVDDDITTRYTIIVGILGDKLPVIYMNGIANLDSDNHDLPKNIVSYNKLKNGDYETSGSKSDKTNITSSIKFFFNNLPSFKQFKDEDNLNYIIFNRRLLMVELLEYYANKPKFSIATLKSRYIAILRVIRIGYNNKLNLNYQLLSYIVSILGDEIDNKEGKNELSPEELERFLDFDIIKLKQKELYNRFYMITNKYTKTAYNLNQDLVLLSLYSLIPPLRNEVKLLEFTFTSKREGDYIYIKGDNVVLDLNEEKKRHFAISFDLNEDAPILAKILKDSYNLYPRQYVFTTKTSYPKLDKKASISSLDDRLFLMFREYGIRIGTNSLRSSYVSKFFEEATKNRKQRSYGEQGKLAERMRTSVKYLILAYNKIIENSHYQVNDVEVKEEPNQDSVITTKQPIHKPSNVNDAYERQLKRNKEYYEKNKEKIIKRQADNNSKNAGKSYIVRLLKFLNDDANYINKAKKETLEKYKIEYEDNKYVSKL